MLTILFDGDSHTNRQTDRQIRTNEVQSNACVQLHMTRMTAKECRNNENGIQHSSTFSTAQHKVYRVQDKLFEHFQVHTNTHTNIRHAIVGCALSLPITTSLQLHWIPPYRYVARKITSTTALVDSNA